MLGLLKRWLGWDSDSGPFDFSGLEPLPQERARSVQPSAATPTTPKRTLKRPPAVPTEPRRAATAAARKAPSAGGKPPPSAAKQPTAATKPPVDASPSGTAKSASSPAKPAATTAQSQPKKAPIDALHNPSLTLDKPSEDGFDPYNTGAFNRSASWERISRHKR